MEVAYDIWNPEIGMTDGIISRFLRRVSERSPKKRRSFVMKAMYARDYRIYEERAQVEIRDGFNSNLVVQYYEDRNKVIIYIPRGWEKEIIVEVGEGNIFCQQQVPYQGLRLSVSEGAVFRGQKAYA